MSRELAGLTAKALEERRTAAGGKAEDGVQEYWEAVAEQLARYASEVYPDAAYLRFERDYYSHRLGLGAVLDAEGREIAGPDLMGQGSYGRKYWLFEEGLISEGFLADCSKRWGDGQTWFELAGRKTLHQAQYEQALGAPAI